MNLLIEESEFLPCDFLEIVRYLRRKNPTAAIRFAQAFESTIVMLAGAPHLGRLRPDLGLPQTRSWRVRGFENYLLFYDILPEKVRILRVLHGSRDLQAELDR
jgi:toxin ParE1/3/4